MADDTTNNCVMGASAADGGLRIRSAYFITGKPSLEMDYAHQLRRFHCTFTNVEVGDRERPECILCTNPPASFREFGEGTNPSVKTVGRAYERAKRE